MSSVGSAGRMPARSLPARRGWGLFWAVMVPAKTADGSVGPEKPGTACAARPDDATSLFRSDGFPKPAWRAWRSVGVAAYPGRGSAIGLKMSEGLAARQA